MILPQVHLRNGADRPVEGMHSAWWHKFSHRNALRPDYLLNRRTLTRSLRRPTCCLVCEQSNDASVRLLRVVAARCVPFMVTSCLVDMSQLGRDAHINGEFHAIQQCCRCVACTYVAFKYISLFFGLFVIDQVADDTRVTARGLLRLPWREPTVLSTLLRLLLPLNEQV